MPFGILNIHTMANLKFEGGINDDDIKKTKDYADAVDKLNNSLTGVNSALPKFADGLDAGLKAIAEKLPDVVASMTKLNAQNKELATNGEKPISVFSQLASSLFSWNGMVSVGITLLTTYGGTIIKWVGDLIKGQTTLTAFGKAMRDNTILANALIQTKLDASKTAQQEITDLTTLYRASQDHNRSLAEKKDVFQALRDQWPNTFGHLTDETIATGKAANGYKALKEQILAAAMAEAAKNKITANYSRILDNNDRIDRERAKNIEIINEQKAVEDSYKKYLNGPITDQLQSVPYYTRLLDNIQKRRDASDKIIYDAFTDIERSNAQNEKFYQQLDKNIHQYGPGIVGHNLEPGMPDSNSNARGDLLSSSPQKAIQAQAEQFAMRADVRKKQMDTELADFDKQLKAELITQEQHNDLSKQANEKFLAGLRTDIGDFSAESINEVLQYQKELVKSKKLGEDQHDVDKAILPAQKLAAEKKLIEDKYNFEIQAANEAGKGTTAIRMRYAQEMAEADKKFAQERKDFELKTTQEVSNAAFSILQNSIKSQSEAKIKQLETQKTSELNNSSLTSSQKKAIEEKYAKKEAEEKTKAFKAEQKASILQAVINGALAITKVTAQTGVASAFIIPGIIAETAIQVATIAAQKAPQYAKGGVHYQSDGRGALLPGYSRTDNMNAYLRSGEAVVVSEAMRDPWARNLVSAINVAYGGRDFSMANPHSGYAIGGIFTDGGNSNRYYNAPMNDQKDLANTIAYQMINNFPPVYVDVKDINTQQSILAQTINRVNL